jgi:hypothetical protein
MNLKAIIVFYLNVDNMSDNNIADYLKRTKDQITIEDELVTQYFIPVKGQKTKVECIYPKFVSDKETMDEAMQMIKNIEETYLCFLTNKAKTE